MVLFNPSIIRLPLHESPSTQIPINYYRNDNVLQNLHQLYRKTVRVALVQHESANQSESRIQKKKALCKKDQLYQRQRIPIIPR